MFDAYVARLVQDYPEDGRELSVVWDAGNGAAGEVLSALARRLPGRHELLFADIDGRFPNHHPDPTVDENLKHLMAAVAAGGAEVGIAFDGDGDRIGVIDGSGRIVRGDQLLQVLAAEVLERHPGAPIIADVKASQTLYDEIATPRRSADHVEDRALVDQGEDGRDGRPARGRDVRAHLLRRPLLRPR